MILNINNWAPTPFFISEPPSQQSETLNRSTNPFNSRRIKPIMSEKIMLKAVEPLYALHEAEIAVQCERFALNLDNDGCYLGGVSARIIAASSQKILDVVPSENAGPCELYLSSGGAKSNTIALNVGQKL